MYRYSYDDIARRYIDTVYRLALARTKSPENAGDVTQEVFLRLLESKKEFREEEHLKAWLLRVTINCTKDMLLSSWFCKNEPLDESMPAEDGVDEIYFLIMRMPEKYRTVLYLYYYEGYKTHEIAQITGRPHGTVKSQLSRGRELLRRFLEEGGEPV
ncbi:MAG: RNA polymerase sigma factor [Candidatus Ornithomonoglobus sp.]